jgi:hypothetical protein
MLTLAVGQFKVTIQTAGKFVWAWFVSGVLVTSSPVFPLPASITFRFFVIFVPGAFDGRSSSRANSTHSSCSDPFA